MKKENVYKFFQQLARSNPEPKTELLYHSSFTLLVAVILSAQATDKSVNKVTPALFDKADTPSKMARLGETEIRKHIKTIGLFNSKAKNIAAASRILMSKYDGTVPKTREELETLPGVGRKTANVILNTAFGLPTIAVDTHIFRVANRTGLARGKTPLVIEKQLEKIVPDQWKRHAHHWLILHGRYICTARKPRCDNCSVNNLCLFDQKSPRGTK